MATELFSLWGGLTGWRSQYGASYQVTATLDGIDIWYVGPDLQSVESLFSRACRRTILRRVFPFLSPPVREIHLERSNSLGMDTMMTMPNERTRSVVQTRDFLQELKRRADVPEEIRNEANRLLRHYPEDWHLDIAATRMPEWWGKPVGRRR
jgi:hypothetical protein